MRRRSFSFYSLYLVSRGMSKYIFALGGCALIHAFPEISLPALSMKDLIVSSSRSKLALLLSEMSIVSVTNIPHLSEARQNMFEALQNCHGANPQIFEQSALLDGTKRATLAIEVQKQQGLVDFPASVASACPYLISATQVFRSIISEVSSAFAASIDYVQQKETASPFTNALQQGQQLEHFVVYNSPTSFATTKNVGNSTKEKNEDLTIDLHVDEGLFIALVPPLLLPTKTLTGNYGNQQKFSGLVIQLPHSNELRSVTFPDESSVVFMVGDGLKRWMSVPSSATTNTGAASSTNTVSLPFHAVPHAMKMLEDTTRLWYGRMFLPAASQFSTELGLSFGMYRDLVKANAPEALVGCLAGGSSLRNDKNCNDTSDYYCWMQCFTPDLLPVCAPGQPYVCVSNTDGSPCDPNAMGCGPRCGNLPEVPFCDATTAITMFMNGFASPVAGQSCVIFLFQGWIMDTKFKFFLGCVGSIALGMLAEWLISLRRGLSAWRRFSEKQKKLFELGFYVCQACMGYILMLLAMTYSVPIFFCVLLGLMFGHIIFVTRKSATIASEAGTPCCEGVEHRMVFKAETDDKHKRFL